MGREKGFTIVEVMLFLAISAALLGVAVASTSGSLKTTRFTDASRSFEAFVEEQYTEVQAGTASRGAGSDTSCTGGSVGASTDCIVLGRVLSFDNPERIDVYTVIADSDPTVPASTDMDAFVRHAPRIWEDSTTPALSHKLDWGVTLGTIQHGPVLTSFNRLAILRSPISENIYLFTYTAPGGNALSATELGSGKVNQNAVICATSTDFGTASGSLVASVMLKGTGSIDTIDSTVKPKSEARIAGLSCL